MLVIRGGAIGDFILTLPAIQLIRESIPGVQIEIMGNHGIVELALASGHADAIRHLDSPAMARMFARNPALDEALCAWLRSFNVVVSYLFDPDGFFRANLERAGVRTLLDAPHRVQEGGPHAQFQLARPLEKLAMWLEPDAAPTIRMPDSYSSTGEIMVAIHPGSGSLKKNWPVQNWCLLGREILNAKPDAKLVLVSGEAERERGVIESIDSAWRSLPWEHWDSLPLPELAKRLPRCSYFLGHDSGVTHLAAACGVSCLAFFGPTDPAIWAPRNHGVQVVQASKGDLTTLPFEDGLSSVLMAIGN